MKAAAKNPAKLDPRAGDRLPYAGHVNDYTLVTRTGELIQMIQLDGIAFETADSETLNHMAAVRDVVMRGIANSNLMLYCHVIRRQVAAELSGEQPAGFARVLDAAWQQRLRGKRLYINDLVLMLVRRPARGKVGFVGGMEIPLIRKFQAGFTAGAKAVNPKITVMVKYAGNTGAAFKDPTKGKELALAEYQAGADIIFHASGSTGLGVFEAARELKKLAIGVDSDQYDEAPGVVLTSMVKRVDTAVFDTIRDLKAGNWQGGVREFGLADSGVTWVYDDRNQAQIPAAVKATVDSLQAEIVAGRIRVPTEP